jgi:hypothetical protein
VAKLGIRIGFKFRRRKACGFESHREHVSRDGVIFQETSGGLYDLTIAGRPVQFDVDPDDFEDALRRSRHGISFTYLVRPLRAAESTGTYSRR